VSVGVDARALHSTGVGRYIREVLAGAFQDPRFGRFVLLGDPGPLAAFAAEHSVSHRVAIHPLLRNWRAARAQLEWVHLSAAGHTRADVWFFPFLDVPLLMHPRRSVVTIHDLIPLKLPAMVRRRERIATRVAVHAGTRYARRVITGSESTRRDLAEMMPAAERKLEVVHYGVSRAFRPIAPGEAIACSRAEGLGPFLLCVGNRYAHKNQVAAVDTLARLRAAGAGVRLVMAGRPDTVCWPQVARHAQAIGVGDAVVDLGEVTETELRCLYAHCTALMFPSLYEGGGLPVLEAMACGSPVIASDRSSLPEVMGDAGFAVDPHDTAAMAAIVLRLLEEPALRAERVRAGVLQAARFTWTETSRRTAEILYRTAAE
jgi:glycosyltransferase involved in cell wall biosynthesis